MSETSRYHVHESIGVGGMGEVFRASIAWVPGVERDVAIKVVKSELAADPHFASLFIDEARVALCLAHSNIVVAHDFGRIELPDAPERWFLAMELIDGVDLGSLLRYRLVEGQRGVPLQAALTIAIEICKGLDYAHRRTDPQGRSLGVVHRDVSPGNVLVSREGEVKVADFGVAKSTLRDVGSLVGTVKGKIPYMAPEQLRGAPLDARVDVYGVGIVLYEMLCGVRAYVDEDEGPALIPDVMAGRHPALGQRAPEIPDALCQIVIRAMDPEPSRRFPSAAALRVELERFALCQRLLLSTPDLAELVEDALVVRKRLAPLEERMRAARRAKAAASGGAGLDFGSALERVLGDAPFSVYTRTTSE